MAVEFAAETVNRGRAERFIFNRHLCCCRNGDFFFVHQSILGDIRFWVGPRLGHLLSSGHLTNRGLLFKRGHSCTIALAPSLRQQQNSPQAAEFCKTKKHGSLSSIRLGRYGGRKGGGLFFMSEVPQAICGRGCRACGQDSRTRTSRAPRGPKYRSACS